MSKKAKNRQKKQSNHLVLAYDLGGTKVAVGAVGADGKVLEEIRVPVVVERGKAAVLAQLTELGKDFIDRFPRIRRVGMASAGPLHPEKGLLLDPTNFASKEGTWGKVPIASILSKRLKRDVILENDAAAAVLAEHWMGAARKAESAIILTLGTGLGTGMVVKGKLVRAGMGLHPEGGHMIVNYADTTAPCGCGNQGCAEAYLSGRSFTRRARARFGNANLDSISIAELARKKDPRAVAAFEEYSYIMAVVMQNFVMLYAPEVIVLTGSFAATSDLFLERSKEHLLHFLKRRRSGVDMMPKIVVSKLHNRAGLLGGAYVALNAER